MSAEPESIPAGPLQDIAFRVPADTRAMMGTLELRLRCEWVHELQSRAASEPPDKAERTRKLAERVIRSFSDYSYSAAQIELSGALADAHRRGDSQGAVLALQDLRGLEHSHPRLPPERAVGHAAGVIAKAADRLSMPERRHSRLFSRNLTRRK
jgi:hypothetical protein